MPRDEDVLQLVSVSILLPSPSARWQDRSPVLNPLCSQAYSQDAYLMDNDSDPEPPPLCYPSAKPSSTAPHPNHSFQTPLDNRQCRPTPAGSPLDNRLPAASNLTLKNSSGDFIPPGWHRGRSSAAAGALDFHFANHNAAIASATLPPPRRSRPPASRHPDGLCHRALSDWYYSQAEAAKRIPPRDRLEPGARSAPAEQHRREMLLHHHQAAAASHDSCWLRGWGGASAPGGRSCSESLLAAYAEYEHNYGRSVETLAQASALVPPRYEPTSQPSPQMTNASRQQDQKASGGHQHQAVTSPTAAVPPSSRQCGQQVAEPQARRIKGEEPAGYKGYSPSFCRKANHLLQQAQSFKDPAHCGSQLDRSSPADSDGGAVPRTQSGSEEERVQGENTEVIPLNQEVVLRQKPPSSRRHPVQGPRPPHYTRSVESPEAPAVTPSAETPSPVPVGSGLHCRTISNLAEHAYDSLSSIPFIG